MSLRPLSIPNPISDAELTASAIAQRRALDQFALRQFLSEAELARHANATPQRVRALREDRIIMPVGRTGAGIFLYDQAALATVLADESRNAKSGHFVGICSGFIPEYLARHGINCRHG
jgi:hypothetical protein